MARPYYTKPPSWFPTAVPTTRGWCHPKTGEVLVCVQGLLNRRSERLDSRVDNLELEDEGEGEGDLVFEIEPGDTEVNPHPGFLLLEPEDE
jgi:hypothetical protein